MKRIYAAFLRLYPREYRDLFGPEVVEVFGQAVEEQRARGLAACTWFLIVELCSAIVSAARHWLDRLSREEGHPQVVPAGNRTQLFRSVQEAQDRVQLNVKKMTHAIANHDFAGAREYSYEERKARAELDRLRDLYGFGENDQLTPQ